MPTNGWHTFVVPASARNRYLKCCMKNGKRLLLLTCSLCMMVASMPNRKDVVSDKPPMNTHLSAMNKYLPFQQYAYGMVKTYDRKSR